MSFDHTVKGKMTDSPRAREAALFHPIKEPE